MHIKRVGSAVLVLGAVCPLTAGGQPIDRRVDANPRGVLEIVNADGEIRVLAWDRNEVQVTGELAENAAELEMRADGDRVIVEVVESNRNRRGNGFGGDEWWGGGTDLSIRAPATIALDIRSRSADIDVTGMRGEQYIGGISSDIETEAYDEALRLQTVSGDIRIEGHDGTATIRASAVSGDIRVGDVRGELWADSVSGDVTLIGGALVRAEFKSVSGDIRVMASIADDARLDAIATSGDIELDFRGNAAGEYRLETFSGTLDACFGPRRTGDDDPRFGRGDALRFTEGNGRARIEARTHSGDIRVCRE